MLKLFHGNAIIIILNVLIMWLFKVNITEQYYFFLDDARNGGWQGFLDRSNDFIRFCCYSHITEMLSLRGGAGESQLAIRWGESR